MQAKRLARLYAVNHYIVSQANPVVLLMSAADANPLLPTPLKNIMRYSTREWLKSSEEFSRRYLRAVPDIGRAVSMFYSVVAQEYQGDINIAPSFTYFDPRKLLAQLTQEEMHMLMMEGQRATWPNLEQIRLSSQIGKTLDKILDEHSLHDVKRSYKQRMAITTPAKQTDAKA
ncbi:MAG: TAG lipase/steryl ester hydrolase/phospholipase A2/LPA acyltransferase [Candidatus Azotimanducaceae bacterium]